MAPTREQITTTIESYVKSVAGGTVDDILNLFADGATVEDPVGSEVRTTRESLREFYGVLENLEQDGEVLTVRIAANEAAFQFRLVTKAGDQRIELSPIDVMSFDDDGKITSMRAFWSPEDMVTH